MISLRMGSALTRRRISPIVRSSLNAGTTMLMSGVGPPSSRSSIGRGTLAFPPEDLPVEPLSWSVAAAG